MSKGVDQAVNAVEERADDRVAKIREAARRKIKAVRAHEREKIDRLRAGADGKLSEEGAAFIASWEGLELTAYLDVVGVLTIGVGHTGSDVRPGMTITRERAFELLQADAKIAADAVTRLVKVSLNQHQEDVLISFTFNCGVGALTDSTLLKVLDQGHHDQVPAQLMRWVNVPPIEGLVDPSTRRVCALEEEVNISPKVSRPFVLAVVASVVLALVFQQPAFLILILGDIVKAGVGAMAPPAEGVTQTEVVALAEHR